MGILLKVDFTSEKANKKEKQEGEMKLKLTLIWYLGNVILCNFVASQSWRRNYIYKQDLRDDPETNLEQ